MYSGPLRSHLQSRSVPFVSFCFPLVVSFLKTLAKPDLSVARHRLTPRHPIVGPLQRVIVVTPVHVIQPLHRHLTTITPPSPLSPHLASPPPHYHLASSSPRLGNIGLDQDLLDPRSRQVDPRRTLRLPCSSLGRIEPQRDAQVVGSRNRLGQVQVGLEGSTRCGRG